MVSASQDSSSALEELCRIYWKPVYGFLRRSGYQREDAEDLTQSYFYRLLKSGSFAERERVTGKLRSYLLGALKRHLADDLREKNALKRGGGQQALPLASSELDAEESQYQYVSPPGDEMTPDRLFDQRWTLEILSRTHQQIREHYDAAGKLKEYELLKPAVAMSGEFDSAAAAKSLGVAPASVRVLVHRLRRHFRAAMKEEVSQTVNSRVEVDEELAHLLSSFS